MDIGLLFIIYWGVIVPVWFYWLFLKPKKEAE